MSVAVLENIAPMLAVARAMMILCRELVMIADNHPRFTMNVDHRYKAANLRPDHPLSIRVPSTPRP